MLIKMTFFSRHQICLLLLVKRTSRLFDGLEDQIELLLLFLLQNLLLTDRLKHLRLNSENHILRLVTNWDQIHSYF